VKGGSPGTELKVIVKWILVASGPDSFYTQWGSIIRSTLSPHGGGCDEFDIFGIYRLAVRPRFFYITLKIETSLHF
jgi:hypothetical protein